VISIIQAGNYSLSVTKIQSQQSHSGKGLTNLNQTITTFACQLVEDYLNSIKDQESKFNKITIEETIDSIKTANNNSAAGIDKIQNELIKNLSIETIKIFTEISV
jgi:hypothetical protein